MLSLLDKCRVIWADGRYGDIVQHDECVDLTHLPAAYLLGEPLVLSFADAGVDGVVEVKIVGVDVDKVYWKGTIDRYVERVYVLLVVQSYAVSGGMLMDMCYTFKLHSLKGV